METPLIAHRCGRAYGPDSSRWARGPRSPGAHSGALRLTCASRATARSPACLHDAYLPLGTTLTGWAPERTAAAGGAAGRPPADVLAGRLLDGEGRATAERPQLVDEVLDLVPPGFTVQ